MVEDCLWHQVFTFLTNSDLLVLCQSGVAGVGDCACRYLFDTVECKDLLMRQGTPGEPTTTSTPLHEILPELSLAYAGLTRRGSYVQWTASTDQNAAARPGLDSLSHLTLDREFLNMPQPLQRLTLERCNALLSISIKSSFYACACADCVQASMQRIITDDILDEELVGEVYRKIVEHAARVIEFGYKIIFRNCRTVQRIEVAGPPDIHMFKVLDQDMYPIPIPVREEPGDRAGPAEAAVTGAEASKSECAKRCKFPNLQSVSFGRTFDCRYIVPFIDNCDFPQLKRVSIGRLQIDLTKFPILFGRLPFIVFGPQYISFEQSCESAPHLPALYIGRVDDQLRFQGPGVFVCDEYAYQGEFKNGLNHGYGRMRSVTGEVYDGSWSCGQRNGRGIVTQANGNVIMGNWLDDSLNGSGYAITRRSDASIPTGEQNISPQWSLPRSFTYFGQWSFSNFNGWGTLTYNDTLLAYGLMNNGYFGRWVRAVKAVRESGGDNEDGERLTLVWEEHEHDQFGYIVKCYQIAINVPSLDATAAVIGGMRCDQPEQARALVEEFGRAQSQSSPTFRASPSPAKDYFVPFRHGFPEEESPYSRRATAYQSTPPRIPEFDARAVNAETPPVTSEAVSRSIPIDVLCVSSPDSRQRRSGSGAQTPSLRSVRRSALNTIVTPRGSPSGHSYDSIMRQIPRRSETLGSSLECLDNDSAQLDVQSPAHVITEEDTVQTEIQQPPQIAPSSRGRGANTKSEGRDRSAMVQAMEVVDEVLSFVKGDEAACDEVLKLFGEFTRALYTRLHTDWLRVDNSRMLVKLKDQARLNSPLPVPDVATVPAWFKSDLLARFSILAEPLSIAQNYASFQEYLEEQTERIKKEHSADAVDSI